MGLLEDDLRALIDADVVPVTVEEVARRVDQSPPQRRAPGRRAGVAAAITLVAFVATAILLSQSDDMERAVVATRGGRPGADGSFIPSTTNIGKQDVLEVTNPDGRRFRITYPTQLDLAGLGFGTGTTLTLPQSVNGSPCCEFGAVMLRGTVAQFYGTAAPTAMYSGVNGDQVRYYAPGLSVAGAETTTIGELVYQFGPWVVRVYDLASQPNGDPMTEAERAQLAISLDATTTRSDYLILKPSKPLAFGNGFKTVFTFGHSPSISGEQQRTDSNSVAVGPEWLCGTTDSDSSIPRHYRPDLTADGAAWCDAKSGLHINAEGTKQFVAATIRGLEIRRDG